MILKPNVQKSTFIKSLPEFIAFYKAEKWMSDNIHFYNEYLADEYGAFKRILTDYFTEQKKMYCVSFINNGCFIINITIPYFVITAKKAIPVNTMEEAQQIYCKIALTKLKDSELLKQYPKDVPVDYSVLKQIIEKENHSLKLLHNK